MAKHNKRKRFFRKRNFNPLERIFKEYEQLTQEEFESGLENLKQSKIGKMLISKGLDLNTITNPKQLTNQISQYNQKERNTIVDLTKKCSVCGKVFKNELYMQGAEYNNVKHYRYICNECINSKWIVDEIDITNYIVE